MKTLKTITRTISSVAILLGIMLFNGCASNGSVVAVSGVHGYSHNYGLQQDSRADSIIRNEILTQNIALHDRVVLEDPTYFTKLTRDPEEFTADQYVPKQDVITYKYKFDKKFYNKPEWRSANQ